MSSVLHIPNKWAVIDVCNRNHHGTDWTAPSVIVTHLQWQEICPCYNSFFAVWDDRQIAVIGSHMQLSLWYVDPILIILYSSLCSTNSNSAMKVPIPHVLMCLYVVLSLCVACICTWQWRLIGYVVKMLCRIVHGTTELQWIYLDLIEIIEIERIGINQTFVTVSHVWSVRPPMIGDRSYLYL